MICPQCGYDIGNRSKCLRCGYEVKTLVAVDEEHKKEDGPETKVIDPDKVYLSNGDDDFEDMYRDPFSLLFGDIFDPISDILGGLLGIHVGRSSSRVRHIHEPEPEPDPTEKKRKKQGKIVEVTDVEIEDANGNKIRPNKKNKKSDDKSKGDK